MSEAEEETKGFKVTDRRKFTSEGELRTEQEASEASEAAKRGSEVEKAPDPAAPPPSVSQAATTAPTSRPAQSTQESQPAQPAQAARDAQTATAEASPELTFLDLISMLATNALVQLGEVPDPSSGEKMENLRAAQDMISFLDMLQKKTEGNLDKNEEEAVEQILYDLRMRFMAKANILKL